MSTWSDYAWYPNWALAPAASAAECITRAANARGIGFLSAAYGLRKYMSTPWYYDVASQLMLSSVWLPPDTPAGACASAPEAMRPADKVAACGFSGDLADFWLTRRDYKVDPLDAVFPAWFFVSAEQVLHILRKRWDATNKVVYDINDFL